MSVDERELTAVGRPGGAVGLHPTIGGAERHRLLHDWNPPAVAFDDRPVPDLVEEAARRRPQCPAITHHGEVVTYEGLIGRADAVAHGLRSMGVRHGDRVGLLCARGSSLAAGALGILRAGAAYVPLDPAYPTERLAYMLTDSGASALVTDGSPPSVSPWAGPTIVAAEAPPAPLGFEPTRVGPADLAYVTYTSGSTGLPKGVMVEHRSLCNLVAWHRRTFDVRPESRCALAASPAFDASIWELWPPLATGSSLHVVDERTRMVPAELGAWLIEELIEQIILPTPLAEALLAQGGLQDSSLRMLIVGGDRLRTRPDPGMPFSLVNCYGPAEVTVVTSAHVVLPRQVDASVPSIGGPIDNTVALVLEPDPGRPGSLRLCPAGAVGELYIGGVGVARGYLGRDDLTAERFVQLDLDGQAGRYYRSGDLVRWKEDGTLDFLGRSDDQVKVRGCRIEPGEVEAAMLQHPEVAAAAAVALPTAPGGGLELCCFVVPVDEGAPTPRDLRRFLLRSLPQHMVPSSIELIDHLPLTANGKIDRGRLGATAAPVGGTHA